MSEHNPQDPAQEPQGPQYGAYGPPDGDGISATPALGGQPYQPHAEAQGYSAPSQGAPYHPYGKPQGHSAHYSAPAQGQPHYPQPQPQTGGPYGGHYPNVPQYQGGSGPYEPKQDLPGRGWPITLIVVGALMSFVVAPILFFAMTVSAAATNLDLDRLTEMADKGGAVGSTQEFKAGESAMIIVQPGDVDWKCTLTDASGAKIDAAHTMRPEPQTGDNAFVATAKIQKDGSYTARCVGPDNQHPKQLVTLSDKLLEGVGKAVVPALGWSSLLGVVGLIMVIVGVIWLIQRNRQRKRILGTYYY